MNADFKTPTFAPDEVAEIHSVSEDLDGTRVKVTGVVADQFPLQIIYIIEKEDGEAWYTGYTSATVSSNSLKKLVTLQ